MGTALNRLLVIIAEFLHRGQHGLIVIIALFGLISVRTMAATLMDELEAVSSRAVGLMAMPRRCEH